MQNPSQSDLDTIAMFRQIKEDLERLRGEQQAILARQRQDATIRAFGQPGQAASAQNDEGAVKDGVYWIGEIIPAATIASPIPTSLPALATDWDATFDADADRIFYRLPSGGGELLHDKGIQDGDHRWRMRFDLPAARRVQALLVGYSAGAAAEPCDIQLKVNGTLTTYTAAVNTLLTQSLTLELKQGNNVISLAAANQVLVVRFFANLFGSGGSFIDPKEHR